MKFTSLSNLFKKCWFRPSQVKWEHKSVVRFLGRIGFITKGLLYAFIGGLIVSSVASDDVNETNESQQGAFLLISSQPNNSGIVYLVAVFCGVVVYSIWRFWEGLTGQGYSDAKSTLSNFFRFRLSPIVSGCIYVAYAYYIITIFIHPVSKVNETKRKSDSTCFPLCWKTKVWQRILLATLGIIFTIAAITQFIPAFTGNFIKDMDEEKLSKNRYFKWLFLFFGHVGFFARGLLFLAVSVLFWVVLTRDDVILDEQSATLAQALQYVAHFSWGKTIIGLIGMGLICYGAFAWMNVYFKVFPSKSVTPENSVGNSVD